MAAPAERSPWNAVRWLLAGAVVVGLTVAALLVTLWARVRALVKRFDGNPPDPLGDREIAVVEIE